MKRFVSPLYFLFGLAAASATVAIIHHKCADTFDCSNGVNAARSTPSTLREWHGTAMIYGSQNVFSADQAKSAAITYCKTGATPDGRYVTPDLTKW